MPLNESKGNMYPWVTHTHTHLGGKCRHECIYCYVDNPKFGGRPPKYSGPLRLLEHEFKVAYGSGKTIFIEHCNDLFAADVPADFIFRILNHCHEYRENTYVFQTKNPERFHSIGKFHHFPKHSIFGCTIETNRDMSKISKAPRAEERAYHMKLLNARKFVTIEPVLDFDVKILARWIAEINPEFLNLGADSKNHVLPEPTVKKIHDLVDELKQYGIELREKHNLNRLKRG